MEIPGFNRRLRLRTLLLSVLLFSILVITVSMGIFVYGNLYDAILQSNERKLFAADVATGLFVDGDLHDSINLKREINHLAYDPAKDILYGTGTASDTLMTLDVTTDPSLRGGATVVGPLGIHARFLTGMTWDPKRQTLYVLEEAPSHSSAPPDETPPSVTYLSRIDTKTGRIHRLMPLTGIAQSRDPEAPAATGLAYDPVSDSLWTLSGSTLCRLTPETGAVVPVGKTGLSGPFELAYSAPAKTLFCLCANGRGLAKLNTTTGAALSAPLTMSPVSDDAKAVVLIRMQALTFDTKSGELFGATRGLMNRDPAADSTIGAPTALITGDRLGVISPINAQVTVGSSVIGYRNEQSPIYRRYARAMGHVRDRLGLTYVYTMVPDSGNWIRYVVDPTEGSEHTNIGWPDLLTDEHTHGVERVIEHRDVYLSDIHAWERWGLLKTAYAPIYSHKPSDDMKGGDTSSRAVAGMDINIDVIQTRTRAALTTVGGVALASLLLGSFTTLFITRRLTEPIAQVKDAAIQIASGQYGGRIYVTEPFELAELATEFNRMSETLAGRLRSMEDENLKIAHERRLQELNRSLLSADVGPTQIEFPIDDPSAVASAIEVSSDGCMAFFTPPRVHFPPGDPFGGGDEGTRANTIAAQSAAADGSGYILSPTGMQALIWLADAPSEIGEALRMQGDLAIIAGRVLSHYGRDWAVKSLLTPLLSDQVYAWILIDDRYGTISHVANRALDLHRMTPPRRDKAPGAEQKLDSLPARLVEVGSDCLVIRSHAANAEALALADATPHMIVVVSRGLDSQEDAEACLRAILPSSAATQA